MAGGYEATPEGIAAVRALFDQLRSRVAELERPTGTSINSLVAQVQAKLAELDSTVTALVAAALGNYYTKSETDSHIASPGNIAPGNVDASGRVTSGGAPLTSLPSFNYQVTTGYKSAWINNDGQVGFSPSTLRVKKDLEPFPDELADAFLLTMTPYLGRYTWDDESEPLKVFVIAEEAAAAGFGPDVVPGDKDGQPETVNYSQLVVPLLAVVKQQQARLAALESRLDLGQ